jgi:anti-sigma-K factor RskA
MKINNMPEPLPEEKRLLLSGYVLGDLTAEEIAHIERLIREEPEVLKELHALQTSFELMPQGLTQVSPPVHLRERIVESPQIESSPPLESPQVELSPAAIGGQRPAGVIWKVLTGVIATSTLVLAADNLLLRQRLAQQVDSDQVAAILQQPNSRLISLTGHDSDAAGTLLFTPGNWQEVIVSLGDLPPLPPDEIYRMWLALENGTVIYCGEFNTEADGSIFVRFTPTETPPKGVKATQLLVTIDGSETEPDPLKEPVMTGII